jgi:hypothetical protein
VVGADLERAADGFDDGGGLDRGDIGHCC